MAYAAILGYGTVGSGVFGVLRRNAALIKRQLGQPLEVKKILDLRSFPGDEAEPLLTSNAGEIIDDPQIGIVAECMGGLNPAYEYVKRAILAGKHVVTSNKELVSVHGAELMALASENNARFLFEASVGGGIPIIRPLRHMLLTEDAYQVSGILNGTTNYILSLMGKHGAGFEETLKDAQAKGYAERDPSADVGGFDACRKLAILLSICSGRQVNFSKIPTEGIAEVTSHDFACAAKLGHTIKLIAKGEIRGGVAEALVAPMLVPANSPFGAVDGVYNAVSVTCGISDNLMFQGRGAGKNPTAGAMASDMAEAVRGGAETPAWVQDGLALADPAESVDSWLVRFESDGANICEAMNAAKRIFGADGLEYTFVANGNKSQAAFFTPPAAKGRFVEKVSGFGRLPGVCVKNSLRLYAGR